MTVITTEGVIEVRDKQYYYEGCAGNSSALKRGSMMSSIECWLLGYFFIVFMAVVQTQEEHSLAINNRKKVNELHSRWDEVVDCSYVDVIQVSRNHCPLWKALLHNNIPNKLICKLRWSSRYLVLHALIVSRRITRNKCYGTRELLQSVFMQLVPSIGRKLLRLWKEIESRAILIKIEMEDDSVWQRINH